MKVLLAEKRGFCGGVERAVKLVEKAVKEGPWPVRVLHEIVHNEDVVRSFREQGVEFYEEINPRWTGGTLVFSAHGVGRKIEEQAMRMPVRLVDATCPLVRSVHRRAAEMEREGKTILFIGNRGHRETEGVAGRINGELIILQNAAEAEVFVPDPEKQYAVLSQTTLSGTEYRKCAEILQKKIPALQLSSGICSATSERQEAVKNLASQCRKIIVIGSGSSSNSRRLRETAEAAGAESILISGLRDLPREFPENAEVIGITSGASAPEYLVTELKDYLRQL